MNSENHESKWLRAFGFPNHRALIVCFYILQEVGAVTKISI